MAVPSMATLRRRILKLCDAAQYLYGPDLTLTQALSQAVTSGTQVLPQMQGLPGFGTDMDLVTGSSELSARVTAIIDGSMWDPAPAGRRRPASRLPAALLTSSRLPQNRVLADRVGVAVEAVTVVSTVVTCRRPTNRWLKECDVILGPPARVPLEAALLVADWFTTRDGQGPDPALAASLTGPHGFAALAPRVIHTPEFMKFAEDRGVVVPSVWPHRDLGRQSQADVLAARAHTPQAHAQWGDSRHVPF